MTESLVILRSSLQEVNTLDNTVSVSSDIVLNSDGTAIEFLENGAVHWKNLPPNEEVIVKSTPILANTVINSLPRPRKPKKGSIVWKAIDHQEHKETILGEDSSGLVHLDPEIYSRFNIRLFHIYKHLGRLLNNGHFIDFKA